MRIEMQVVWPLLLSRLTGGMRSFSVEMERDCGHQSPSVDPGDPHPSMTEGDLSCAKCSSLLLHPLVLHCGHVVCAACAPPLPSPACPSCSKVQPTVGPLRVCSLIQDTVAALFPHLLRQRQAEAGAESESGPSSSGVGGESTSVERAWAERRAVVQEMNEARGEGERGKRAAMVVQARKKSAIHEGVGCDSCGVREGAERERGQDQVGEELTWDV